MPKKQCAVALLAAGKGTRLKLSKPKALAPVLGQTLMDFALESIINFGREGDYDLRIGVVLGHKKEELQDYLTQNYQDLLSQRTLGTCIQEEQKGTGHALQCYFNALPEMWNCEYTIVTCVDTPLISKDIYLEMFNHMERNPCEGIAVSFETNHPSGYGRILRGDKGFKIIEEKDANASESLIKEVNSGLYLLKTSYIKKYLGNLKNNNKSGEFYLTDLFKQSENVRALPFRNEETFLGVNDASQLERVTHLLRNKKIEILRDEGVFIEDSSSLQIDWRVKVGKGSFISPFNCLKGETTIGENVEIEPYCFIKNSIIGNGAKVLGHSHLESCSIGEKAQVGPMARLRPGADVHSECKVGNFVEIKKATLKKGAKVSHLSYVGDAEIGENSNIGCGFITCNYDGVSKHKTKIGKNSFIGSDCQMIAPVEVGSNAFIAAGSTISKNVPNEAFAISRGRQITKEGQAKRFLKKKG